MLPEDVLDPVPLRPLWGNVVVDCTKKNQEKELVRADECLTNKVLYSKVLQSISTCGSQ